MLPGLILRVVLLATIMSFGDSYNKGRLEATNWSSQPAAVKGVQLPAGMIQFEFHADGSLTYKIGPTIRYTGTYSFGAGENVTLHLDQMLAGRRSHTEKVTISGNQLTITDSDGTALTFDKAK